METIFSMDVMKWIWLGVMIACVVFEAFTFSLTTIWFALGALVMIFLSLAPISLVWQFLIFILISCALLFFTRPVAIKKLKVQKTNVNSLEGKKAVVTKKITELEKGEAKLNGNIWTASTVDGSELEKGEIAVVESVEGTTLILKKEGSETKATQEGE